jgi:hypothetical protein
VHSCLGRGNDGHIQNLYSLQREILSLGFVIIILVTCGIIAVFALTACHLVIISLFKLKPFQ